MSSVFSGMSVALSGLQASQIALNTTSHNVANADTEGYVRQQAMQVDKTYLKSGQYSAGTGSVIEEVRQIRSVFLDNMYRKEESSLGYWQIRQDTVEDIEAVMDDLDEDGGLQAAMDDFFDAWDEVSKDTTGGSVRSSLIEYADSMVEMMNLFAEQLNEMQENLDSQIVSMTKDINSISEQVAKLNEEIVCSEVNGDNANDLRDQANSLLDTLSEYVNITVSTDSNGMYKVAVGGVSLINGNDYKELTTKTLSSNGTFHTVLWEESGKEMKLTGGMLLGLIESRGDVVGGDGEESNGSVTETDSLADDASIYNFSGDSENLIPELKKGLNMLVNLLARKVNEIHSSGEGLDGSTGIDFFVKIDDSLPLEAGNIQVNPIFDDTDKIAASSIEGSDDGAIASEIYNFTNTEYFKNDSLSMNIDNFYTMLVDWVGTEGQEAKTFVTNQTTLVSQVESNKQSLSAVSMDEELTNLVKYQHAYNASARVMSTVDSMLETLIGMV